MAEVELSEKFARREAIEKGEISDLKISAGFNPYMEFSRKEIKEYEKHFKKFDLNGDHVLDFEELKRMMEILGAPQTHLALKQMIKDVDEDFDGTINFREFLLIFKKARDGELSMDCGLSALARLTSIDVDVAGVGGAKDFFEAKVWALANPEKHREQQDWTCARLARDVMASGWWSFVLVLA
ncbi:EF-Hand domain-containing protein, putative [Ixodes scapularis]|uniref:EF-Hand domain-containing protein, putative n=1 Tax=Ixodes scapularis TaxID=6945 RepID=B7PIV6_IXOSC|nr:EF-Hand domain-containing protein, putative [Ixodes scapularis]|eukprot:XP_002406497.1 EF-Hand domain-containing protein, putative [Ixodes scapularis]